jgi:hypothetical protein
MMAVKCMGFYERDLQRYSSLVGVAEGDGCYLKETWRACVYEIVHKIMIKFAGNRPCVVALRSGMLFKNTVIANPEARAMA